MFICPICAQPLEAGDTTYRCSRGHSYDRSAQGHLYLLPANKKHSSLPGDNPEMVRGRTRFLDTGSYAPLSDALNEEICTVSGERPRILDAGCGEGYYTTRLDAYLRANGKAPVLFGIDLSKTAIKHAARRCQSGLFAVASLFELPVAEGSIDICYNVFSPLCPPEFARVLAPDGAFIAVYPAARHLFGLKEILYEQPYENPEKDFALPGFTIASRRRLTYPFSLAGQELIQSLYHMTPYCYKTPIAGAERLSACETLVTEADFWLITYRREDC